MIKVFNNHKFIESILGLRPVAFKEIFGKEKNKDFLKFIKKNRITSSYHEDFYSYAMLKLCMDLCEKSDTFVAIDKDGKIVTTETTPLTDYEKNNFRSELIAIKV